MAPDPLGRRLWPIIGKRIRSARKECGMNMAALSLSVHASRQLLYLVEDGTRGLSLATLYRIAKVTGKPLSYFLPDVDDV